MTDEPTRRSGREPEPDRLDNPNQQVVRPDGSGPADEGDGGSQPAAPKNKGGRPRKDDAADTAAETPPEPAERERKGS